METTKAVIENASVHKISELFPRKPKNLKFNDTDAIVVTARTEDGKQVTKTFYFCLKPDGTFSQDTISKDGAQARRRRLANFIKYYKLTGDVKNYNIREDIGKWVGKTVEVLLDEKEEGIYVP